MAIKVDLKYIVAEQKVLTLLKIIQMANKTKIAIDNPMMSSSLLISSQWGLSILINPEYNLNSCLLRADYNSH